MWMRQRFEQVRYGAFRDFHAYFAAAVWPRETPGSTAVIISKHLLVQSGERRNAENLSEHRFPGSSPSRMQQVSHQHSPWATMR